jgi:hypothetical protein
MSSRLKFNSSISFDRSIFNDDNIILFASVDLTPPPVFESLLTLNDDKQLFQSLSRFVVSLATTSFARLLRFAFVMGPIVAVVVVVVVVVVVLVE